MKPRIAITGQGTPSIKDGWYGETEAYFRAVWQAGGLPLMLPPMETIAKEAASQLDALILTGGWDADPSLYGQEKHPQTDGINPARDAAEIALLHAFERANKPVLGVCRGIQMMAVGLGGTLLQHLPDDPTVILNHSDRNVRHLARLSPGSRIRHIYGCETIRVNSTHHQAVHQLPPGFAATAFSPDGVIEAMEKGRMLGVQWHPERIIHEGHLCIFEDFIRRIGG